MPLSRRPWQEELEIIDRTLKAISGVRDPQELVRVYWNGIGKLVPGNDYVALSRRNVEQPYYLITRSSRFTQNLNPWTERGKLPRLSGGLLGEIIYANQPVIIEDLPPRVRSDDPARSYLEGFQSLVALPQYDEGEELNATVMLFHADFEFDRTIIPMMHWQAGLFGRGTQNLVLRNQLDDALAALDKELQAVGEIQRSLLPHELPAIPGFELAADYVTSARAGGDYYDFFPLSGGRWGLFIADVSGHGTPAAVVMAITHAIAHAKPDTHTPPAAMLTYLNAQLAHSYTREGTFVTAFYAILDPATRILTYSAAGHNPPRLVRNGQVISLDQASSLPLGIVEEQAYSQATVALQGGDLLLLYTDGITEAMPLPKQDRPFELFGQNRLDDVLIECAAANAPRCIERIRAEVAAFSENAPANDDRTLIALRCG